MSEVTQLPEGADATACSSSSPARPSAGSTPRSTRSWPRWRSPTAW